MRNHTNCKAVIFYDFFRSFVTKDCHFRSIKEILFKVLQVTLSAVVSKKVQQLSHFALRIQALEEGIVSIENEKKKAIEENTKLTYALTAVF